jgi:hypothetical protein
MELHLQVIWVALLLALAIDHHGELLVWTEEQVFKLRCMYGRQHFALESGKFPLISFSPTGAMRREGTVGVEWWCTRQRR